MASLNRVLPYFSKDILLVDPPIHLKERYGKLALSGSTAPPLGLCHLAAICRADGFDAAILDANATGLTLDQAAREIARQKPRVVGLTASTVSVSNAARLAAAVKSLWPNGLVILGGPHISATPEATMERYDCFDLGVLREGEQTLVELLQAVRADGDLSSIPGLILRNGSGTRRTDFRPFIRDLDQLPMPAWDLLPDLARYYKPVSLSYRQLPSTSLVTSRGCTGKCSFCDRTVFGNACRCFSAEYLMGMVKELYHRYGIRDILFDDDNFLLFKERLFRFCELLLRSGMNISWACNARVDRVNEEMLRILSRAGCWQIAYGIESGDQGILDVLHKGIRLEQIQRALHLTRKAGMMTKGFFMIGAPLETRETLNRTLDAILRLPLDDFQTTFFTPLPGCQLYETAGQYGVLEGDWSMMNMWNPVFVPNKLTKHELIHYSKRMFIRFYLRPPVVWRYVKALRRPGAAGKLLTGVYSMIQYQLFG